MYPVSILLAFSARDDPTNYIYQFSNVFRSEPSPTEAECASCAGKSIAIAYIAYGNNPNNVQLAKDTDNEEMAKCQGPADPTYDTCIAQYGTIFAGEPDSEAALCTGCTARALGAGFAVYGVNWIT